MREYGKIGPKFWIGATGKKLRAAGPEAQLVALYLMTSPHANMLGMYYIPMAYIAHETGMTMEGASKGLQRAIEAGFCDYDQASETVWVIEMAKFQIAEELSGKDLRIKGVQNEYDSLPTNPFLSRFYDQYAAAFCMTRKRGNRASDISPLQAPSKPLASQEQEQEQEQEYSDAGAPTPVEAKAKKPKTAPRKTPMPNDFEVSTRVRRWAAEKSHDDLDKHFENFVSVCRKSGYAYADWDEAFMDAVRKNWARIPIASKPTPKDYL